MPRGAVPCPAAGCSAAGCRAAPCGAVPCCAVMRAVLCVLFRACQALVDEVSSSSKEVFHTRFVRTALLNHIEGSQLSSARLGSAQLSSVIAQQCVAQRRATPCGAVPYPAVRCCAVRRCAVLFFRTHRSTKYHAITRYQVPVCMCVLVFLLSALIVLPLGPLVVFFPANYTRTADQNVISPTSTQHSIGQSALCTSCT